MNIHELAQRHENDHPGYFLADWYDAAFPSHEVYLRVVMQVEHTLSTIPEFVLRTLDVGVSEVGEIGQILGLDFAIIYSTLDQMQKDGLVTLLAQNAEKRRREAINITKKGREILQRLTILRPEEETFKLCLDALTGELFSHRRLRSRRSVEEAGLHEIVPTISQARETDLDLVPLQRLWRDVRQSMTRSAQKKEVLAIQSLESTTLGFRQLRVLQFVRPEDGTLLVHVYDGAERSPQHEVALLKMEASGMMALRADKKRGPEVGQDPILEIVGANQYAKAKQEAAEQARLRAAIVERERRIDEVRELQRSSSVTDDQAQANQQISDLKTEVERLQEQISESASRAPAIEILSTVEHRPKLLQALSEAKHRITIVSPWIAPVAVNRELLDKLAETVARGVEVRIGYGFGEVDYKEKQTLQSLQLIRRSKGGNLLQVHRLNDTHAKVVICDDSYLITTSFNWLSFAGRVDWGNRVEFGTLTRDPHAVRTMITTLEPLFQAATAALDQG